MNLLLRKTAVKLPGRESAVYGFMRTKNNAHHREPVRTLARNDVFFLTTLNYNFPS